MSQYVDLFAKNEHMLLSAYAQIYLKEFFYKFLAQKLGLWQIVPRFCFISCNFKLNTS